MCLMVIICVTGLIEPVVTDSDNNRLLAPFSANEFRRAILHMHPTKAPGPDGMNPAFYQKFWDIIGEFVVTSC